MTASPASAPAPGALIALTAEIARLDTAWREARDVYDGLVRNRANLESDASSTDEMLRATKARHQQELFTVEQAARDRHAELHALDQSLSAQLAEVAALGAARQDVIAQFQAQLHA
jgi:hypothetical protein